MIPVPSARVIIAVSLLAAALAMPSRAAEKLPAVPKLVYRQIGAGFTLALEAARQKKTFFLCDPDKTVCISMTEIGWKKPFIITRAGGVLPGFDVIDTSAAKDRQAAHHSVLPGYLRNVPLYPPAVAWEKLSPTRALW
jgi:hypothetical protein